LSFVYAAFVVSYTKELLLVSVAGVLSGTQVVEDSLWTEETDHVKSLFIWRLLHPRLDRLAVHWTRQVQRRRWVRWWFGWLWLGCFRLRWRHEVLLRSPVQICHYSPELSSCRLQSTHR